MGKGLQAIMAPWTRTATERFGVGKSICAHLCVSLCVCMRINFSMLSHWVMMNCLSIVQLTITSCLMLYEQVQKASSRGTVECAHTIQFQPKDLIF